MSESNADSVEFSAEKNGLAVPQTRSAALRSPTVYWMNLAGWLLLASFWMPVSIGCDGMEQRSSDILNASLDTLDEQVIRSSAIITTYGDGVVWAIALPVIAIVGSRRLFATLFKIQLAMMLALMTAILYQDYWNRQLVEGILEFLPILFFATFFVIRPMIRGDLVFAWSRLQLVAILAVTIWLHLACIFSRSLLWGYFVCLLACVLMFVAVMVVRHRIEHDLWDPRVPVLKPQFSIKQEFFWSTSIALLLFYYKHVEDLARSITG
ncbi:MAG: hypothetical protein U0930_16835 [Pirellulales bacterium]